MTLEKIIRSDTGIGALNPRHIAWLQALVKVSFRTMSSALVFYVEDQQNYIYLMPTNEPDDKTPRNSKPIESDVFAESEDEANAMLTEMIKKTEFFAVITPYYEIKIVREFPDKVINGEKFEPAINPL
jgi:hypothetical protein